MNTLILNKIKLALLLQGVSNITIQTYGNDVRIVHNPSKMMFDFRPYLNGYVIIDQDDQELFIFSSLSDVASYIYPFIIDFFMAKQRTAIDSEKSFFMVYSSSKNNNNGISLDIIEQEINVKYEHPEQVFSYEMLKQYAQHTSLEYNKILCFKFNSLCTNIARETRRGYGNHICVNKHTFHKMLDLWHPKLKLNLLDMKCILLNEKNVGR